MRIRKNQIRNKGKKYINYKKVSLFIFIFLSMFIIFLLPTKNPDIVNGLEFSLHDAFSLLAFFLLWSLLFIFNFVFISIFSGKWGFLRLIVTVKNEKQSKFFPHLILYFISLFSVGLAGFFLYTYFFNSEQNSIFLSAMIAPLLKSFIAISLAYKSLYRLFLLKMLQRFYTKWNLF